MRVLAWLIGLLTCALPAWTAERAAVDYTALRTEFKTVGLLPTIVPGLVPHREEVARRYDSEARRHLQAAGFTVIDPDAMREIESRLAKAVGGLYDPMTGKVDREKYEAHERYARAQYLDTHRVDGFFQLAVVPRTARSESSTAKWDGVEERVTGQSGLKSFMTGATGRFGEGTVPALSLVGYIEDREGNERYGRIVGLQLLGYVRNGWVPKMLDVDPQHLLKDPARDARAFALIFDPLTGTQTDTKAKLELAPVMPREAESPVDRKKILTDFKRIAVLPVDMSAVGERPEVAARLDALIRSRLIALGFEVVGGDDFPAVWQELQTAAGGFFDPITGELDADRYQAARREAWRRLQQRHGVSAMMQPAIVRREATFQSGVAKWDGASQVITGNKSRFGAMFSASGQYIGQIDALSLRMRMIDLLDATVFQDYGGIQPASRLEVGRFVKLPESQLLSDPALEAQAVNLSLAELDVRKPVKR